MKRDFVPGRWSRTTGRAIPDPQASELDNVVPLRRELSPVDPPRTAEDDAYRARALRWVLVIDLAAIAAFAIVMFVARHH